MPALSKEEAAARLLASQQRYAEEIRRAVAEAENRMLDLVARRIERGIDTPGWAERKLAEVRTLSRQLGVEVATVQRELQRIEEMIQAAYAEGASVADTELAAAGIRDIAAPISATPFGASRTLAQATVDALGSAHFRILRAAEDAYRRTVADASQQVLLGTATRRQAAQQVLNRLADSGITGFVDAAGRNWDLASYAETAVRSTTAQASVQGHLDRLTEHGQDLVIVSAHGNCCPLCSHWENRVLSISGASEQYPSVAEARDAGLLHCNCRHTLDLYLEGYTKPREVQYDPEGYKVRQRQRYNERQIRRWKRRELAALDDTTRARARGRVREWQAAQRQLVSDNDLRRDYGRESATRAR